MEHRLSRRHDAIHKVVIYNRFTGLLTGVANNICTDGVHIVMDKVIAQPLQFVELALHTTTGAIECFRALVIHHHKNDLGLMFCFDETKVRREEL